MGVVKEVKEKEQEAGEVLSALLQLREEVSAEEVLGRFEEPFERLRDEFGKEYEELGLDEVVVAALTPLVRCLLIFLRLLPLPPRSLRFSPISTNATDASDPPFPSLFLPSFFISSSFFAPPYPRAAPPPLDLLGPPPLPLLHRFLPPPPPPSLPNRRVPLVGVEQGLDGSVRGGGEDGGG